MITLGLIFVMLLFSACDQKEERIKNARKFIGQWDYDRAITELSAYQNQKDAEIQYLLGYCKLRKNDFAEATKYFNQCLGVDTLFSDSIVRVYTTLAKNALKADESAKALLLYQHLAKLVPHYNQANNLFLIGDLNFDQGNYPLAIAAYTKALEIDSSSMQAKRSEIRLIKALLECDSLRPALKLSQKRYDRFKSTENILQLGEVKFALGKHLFENGITDSAKICFKEVISQQEPKSLLDDSYFYLGEVYYHQDSLIQALEAYTKVLKLNPYQKGEIVKKSQERIRAIKEKK